MPDIHNKLVYGESFSKEKFKLPSKEFGIMPFWFVNGEMDYDEMEKQIKEFADKGIPGFYFHSRFGIKDYMPYLGEEWMKRYNFTAQKAKEYGMQVWVYDEYNWPSGTCNQEIMAENPDLTSRYLQLVVNDIPGQFFTFMEGTDSRYNDLEQSEPIFACAILEEDIAQGKNNIVNLMPNLAFDKVITWEAPKGPWKLCYFIERRASWYADVLNEDATKEFIRKTHQNYKEHVPGELSDSIVGFYTDEPAMHYFEAGCDNNIVPWSGKMFKIFKEINGYDLKLHLPQLFFDIGDDYHKVRHDFWSALSKQYEKAFYQQIHEWCKDNGVLFTGHLLHEEWLRKHAKSGGNLFHMLKNLDMTGVDHLYPRIGTREMPDEHVALKIASSAAHQNGSTRLICESMGGAYWDCTMERMKWIADWEYVLGVNILNPHGFHYSIEGERKRDWPPSQFYHHTWWKDYGRFNDYLKRLGFLMTGGKHVAKIAVLYPINTIWANYVPKKADPCSDICEKDFVYLTDTLLRLHYDFDYVDEDMLRKMEIRDGKIHIKGEEYSLLILPPMTHIKENTLKLIKAFYDGGGQIIGDTLLPVDLLEPQGEFGLDVIEEMFHIDPAGIRTGYLQRENQDYKIHFNENENGGKACFIEGPGLCELEEPVILKDVVSKCIDWDISINNDEIFYLYRIKDGVPFYFLINPTGQTYDVEISIRRYGIPKIYQLISGEIQDLCNYKRDGEIVTLRYRFEAYGSAVFSFEEGCAPHMEDADFEVTSVEDGKVMGYSLDGNARGVYTDGEKKITLQVQGGSPLSSLNLGDQWDFQVSIDNALVIQNWKFAMSGDHNKHFYKEDYVMTDEWLDYTMGGWELQLPYERDQAEYPVDVLYKAQFTAKYIPEDIKLLIDGFKCETYDLYINGKKVEEKGERSFLDAEIRQIYIRDYVREGVNDIGIKMIVHKKSHGLLDYIKITGTFALEGDDPATIVTSRAHIKTGTWTKQGYPYFSGTGLLTQTINIPEEYTVNKVLKLKMNCGKDVAEVTVNGQNAGTCLWEPYTIDITGLVKAGENTISIAVTNTLVNLLKGEAQDSGIFHAEILAYQQIEMDIPEV